MHGAELEDLEGLAAAAHALLPEEDGAGRVELDDDRDDAHERQDEDAEQAADDEVEHALDAHVEAPELGVGDVEQRDALDVVHERPRADDLEEARDDVHAHAAVGAGAHDAQEVVVAGAREGDDHAVDALRRHDRVEVAQGADHRQRGTLVAVVPRLAVVEEPDEVDAVLGVAGDLGGHGVADLAGPDDQHPLLERGPRPDRDPADPAGQRDHQDRDEPVGDQGRDRRLGPKLEHEHDEEHPAGGGERGQAGEALAEVEAADAARRLPVQAVDPQRGHEVRRQQDQDDEADLGIAVERTVELVEQRQVVEARGHPHREQRRGQEGGDVRGDRGDDPQARRPPRPRAGPAAGRGSAARTSLFEGPIAHVSYIGNTFGKHEGSLTHRERSLVRPQRHLPPTPLKAREAAQLAAGAYPARGIANPLAGDPADRMPLPRGPPAYTDDADDYDRRAAGSPSRRCQ